MKKVIDKDGKIIVLVGGGGHCRSVLDTLNRTNEYKKILITDPNIPVGTIIDGAEVVGDDSVLPNLLEQGIKYAFITTGSIGEKDNIELRRKLYDKVNDIGFIIPKIIDQSAVVSCSANILDGVFVGKNAVINVGSQIGKMTIINTGAIIEHECIIGDYSHVSVGAVLAGQVVIEKGVFVGANSTIIQCKRVGEYSVIGANSVVLSDVPDNYTALGVFKTHN